MPALLAQVGVIPIEGEPQDCNREMRVRFSRSATNFLSYTIFFIDLGPDCLKTIGP